MPKKPKRVSNQLIQDIICLVYDENIRTVSHHQTQLLSPFDRKSGRERQLDQIESFGDKRLVAFGVSQLLQFLWLSEL